ncbi:CAP domain-containing protein [Cognatishimia sp.]|uniref:CAP domain-containing protein n=1 Tax=Cognatishimia sp. TaxID=2211648 RepID=UPI003514CA07
MRFIAVLMTIVITVSGCTIGAPSAPTLGSDGKPLPRLYKIKDRDVGKIQLRMLDSVNALRRAAGVSAIEMDANLIAAAATHALDMSVQNRPWHFGSDGSSPLERVARSGFTGELIGETISETFETELETLAAWTEEPGSRAVIIDPDATDMGFAWLQEPNGKIWWVMVLGAETKPELIAEAQ